MNSVQARFRTMAEIRQDLEAGRDSVTGLCRLYREAAVALDAGGPTLRSILGLEPSPQAQALDAGGLQEDQPLYGMPILIKDNIATAGTLSTTGGSLALQDWRPGTDATLVQRLRQAGALIFGKTNLSEWANFRSTRSTSGWSSVGRQTRNPHVLDRNPSGSSSGSAVAVSAGLCAGAIGTETDGSITSPASMNGIVGLKPTVGLVSRTGIIPISHRQDTAGPMTRSVQDAACLLAAMSGPDPADEATRQLPVDLDRQYDRHLGASNLAGLHIGVLQTPDWALPQIKPLYRAAVDIFRDLRATLAEGLNPTTPGWGPQEVLVLKTDFKADLNAFLASQAIPPPIGNLAALIAFNRQHADEIMPFFGQELLLQSEETSREDPQYGQAVAELKRMARDEYLLQLLDGYGVDLLIAPTANPSALTDYLLGPTGSGSFSSPAAVAGFPHLTVPMGQVSRLPVGLSFVGRPFSEQILLHAADCFERALDLDLRPQYLPSLTWPAVAGKSPS